ncbi:DUF2461 domain-containing protein [Niabella beijingensis]|uniref:DUF2461 domain-containing protein n=1 Tax=Niabella beijingensis TaxID=2872700 RepID=UPI001CBDD870|nr:DUF2461 domain-containing protein [Niabella beijingensis]MBZ4189732.1 DUF2461 domain-containing protein [Niabella beijingensis]
MIQKSTLKFLATLKNNNNKPWFDANRKAYEAARADYAGFIEALIAAFGKSEPSITHLTAKDCLFRINRDVRFSKDKSPYKSNFGAYINPEGKKSLKAGYYLHLEPGGSFIGGGLWQPMPAELAKIRQEIDYNLPEFEKVLHSKKFRDIYGGLTVEEGQVLSRVPKGYEPDNPAAAYLKYKSFTALANLPDTELTSASLLTTAVKAFQTLQPLVRFLNSGISE